MHELIASPFLDHHLLLRPGRQQGLKIPTSKYRELQQTRVDQPCPSWLVDAAHRAWALDLNERRTGEAVLVRQPSLYGYARASYELNLGCNYDCPFCYLGRKRFEGLGWRDRARLLRIMRDAGVLWLQLTGGEPLIDPLFLEVYALAYELGMMLTISTNGSRLHNATILDLLTRYRPYRVVVSIYGATEATYDRVTQRRGTFKLFRRGLAAAREAGLPLRFNVIVVEQNKHEEAEMRALADEFGDDHHVYSNISPTIHSGPESLTSQSTEHLRARTPFTGCNAGVTHFHADPFGRASICKVGRDEQVDLIAEGIEGLSQLPPIADKLMLRTGGCSGCALQGSCGVCRPLAKRYQEANAPLASYCQHGRR
ncbi:Radical SAM superfamily enzyme, MoaA/NifB/PqqE/SkfB family [Saccharopolyspora kobensis]|uniref:Radical SAM superfamily enzyme, MoaA/NifB/PqqE/SkfB family n=1 Tax=Saccharopolyspora kobensis TaxID=146035 RepID=A0A1H6DZ99_9PSEU|nr:radical SAM protein [Saccharopolyspora kobensis]SEG90662.1 Radical SAM superfamily enzyme, MoaA/NifB/PqqE/SkfB family [Saccharopolyspora kobensis]SFD93049.1 Radical SAM superfamily enzyme, MoaA/NifB/PqqE/SkfB family [Saccharopolyspora kobensis]